MTDSAEGPAPTFEAATLRLAAMTLLNRADHVYAVAELLGHHSKDEIDALCRGYTRTFTDEEFFADVLALITELLANVPKKSNLPEIAAVMVAVELEKRTITTAEQVRKSLDALLAAGIIPVFMQQRLEALRNDGPLSLQ